MAFKQMISAEHSTWLDVAHQLDVINSTRAANAVLVTLNDTLIASNVSDVSNSDVNLTKINTTSTTTADMIDVALTGLNGDEFIEVFTSVNFSSTNTSDVFKVRLNIDGNYFPVNDWVYRKAIITSSTGLHAPIVLHGSLTLTGQTALDVKTQWAADSAPSGTGYSGYQVLVVKIRESR